MQCVRATSTAAMFLLLGTIAPTYSQRGEQNERQQGWRQQGAPPAAQQQRTQRQSQQSQARRQQQQQGQRSQQARQQQQQQRTRQQAATWQQQRGWLRQGAWRGNTTWQQSRARRWEGEHRTWAQRGGYGGYYIPQDRFSRYFGSQNWFRMNSRPTMYMGYPRFSYSGFSFLLLDPYPEYWGDNWYATDDVYVDYDDGYYLYNRRHPSVRLAITVAL